MKAPQTRTLVVLLSVALALRLLLVFTSIGTNDVTFWILWERLISKHGISLAYAEHPYLNHPPLSLLILQLTAKVSRVTGIELTDLFRVVQSAADVTTAWLVFLIARISRIERPLLPAILYAFCPAAIFISGFHGNSDPMMVMFVALSVLLHLQQRPVFSGIALALATGIKILPLFLLPFFALMIAGKRSRMRFLSGYTVVFVLIFLPSLLTGGGVVLERIFGYSAVSSAGRWGIPSLLLHVGLLSDDLSSSFADAAVWYVEHGKIFVLASLGLLLLMFVRRAMRPLPMTSGLAAGLPALVFLVLLGFAPGFGVQYLLWPLPFVWFLLGRHHAIVYALVISIYAFVTYTAWSGSFPWWYADSINASDSMGIVTIAAIPVWTYVIWLSVAGTRRLLLEADRSRPAKIRESQSDDFQT